MMPPWSVDEWRARIGSSWAAVGRPVGRSSHKQRRYLVYYSPGGGGMVSSQDHIILMVTVLAFFVLIASLIILLPLKTECSQLDVKQLSGVLLPKDLFVSKNSVRPGVCIVGALAITDVGTMELKMAILADSLLLRCGEIEMNPGPLGRDLEKVDNSYVLTEDDIREIYLELVTIKANYYQFGMMLGLPPGELQTIQQTHSQNVAQALTQVLLTWLRQLYNVEKYGPPTWQRLVEAVDSPAGGNNHALAMHITSKHSAIGTSTTPTKRIRLTDSPQPTIISTESTPPPLSRWHQLLVDFYLASQALSDAWPPVKTVQFVQLALVQQRGNTRHIGLKTVRADIDAVYGHKTNTDFFDMFTDLKRSSLCLLEGRPGSGKTTLMIYAAHQWANGRVLTSQSIKLVFLVQLRRLGGRDDVSLQDLLQVACSDFSTEDMEHVVKYICEKRGEGIVFALDGFDEYAPGNNPENFISQLIMKKIFCRSIVIVSSRPAATQSFRLIATKWIEVVGFLKKEVIQYVDCYFEPNGELERAKQLKQHLEQHRNLMNLCYLPLHCAMLVFMYEAEDATLPVTETKFYCDFTLSILIRSICKQSEHANSTHKLKSYDYLPCKERNIFKRVCKLAFEATIASQQVFEKSELDKVCFSDSLERVDGSLGLVVIDRYFVKLGTDETYTFLHLTLQEYLCAVHIAELSESERMNIVSTHCSEQYLHVVWRFLFGMLNYSNESTVELFKLILGASRNDHLLHIQCAYESQHRSAYSDVLHFHENGLHFQNVGSDLTYIIYVLKTAEYSSISLWFESCDFSVDEAIALLKAVGDRQLSLIVRWGTAVQSLMDALSSRVSAPGLIELYLNSIAGTAGTAGMGMKTNLQHSTNLTRLRLNGIDIINFGLEEGFKYWPNLEQLHIRDTSCPLTVLDAIKHHTNLVELSLCTCHINDIEAWRVLVESLKFTSKLHSINLGGNHLHDDGLQALFEGIKNNGELKELNLVDVGLTDKSIPYLTEFIKSARNLEILDVWRNQFTPGGETILGKAVRERNSVNIRGVYVANLKLQI